MGPYGGGSPSQRASLLPAARQPAASNGSGQGMVRPPTGATDNPTSNGAMRPAQRLAQRRRGQRGPAPMHTD
jgi:hypothetical protein